MEEKDLKNEPSEETAEEVKEEVKEEKAGEEEIRKEQETAKADEAGEIPEEKAPGEEAAEGEITKEEETKEAEPCDEAQEAPRKERKLNWARKGRKDAEEENAKAADELAGKIAEANDKYIRLLAEFDNFRTRSEQEKSRMFDMGAKNVIEKILDVVDNFERGLGQIPEDKAEDPFVQGMDKTYKQLLKTLESLGVTPIEAVGKEFDPNFHNAVMHIEDENAGENIVVEEFQKGYMYKDHVVRFSMVKVAN